MSDSTSDGAGMYLAAYRDEFWIRRRGEIAASTLEVESRDVTPYEKFDHDRVAY
jgi:hypothetical protein